MPTVFAEIESDIRLAAGLGSSAAATVAGLRIFEHVNGPLSDATLLATATALEGHADNAAPSLFGGMTSVVERDPTSHDGFTAAGESVRALRWEWPRDLRFVVATPFTGLADREGACGAVADDCAQGRGVQPSARAFAGSRAAAWRI